MQRIIPKPGDVGWSTILKQFVLYKSAEGRAKKTIYDYDKTVAQFFRRYPDAWPDDLRGSLLDFLADEIKPATYTQTDIPARLLRVLRR